jgi:hypothetical protein
MQRCHQRMMTVLRARYLRLSSKKSRMGLISKGFHFLGIDYLPTQPADNTNRASVERVALHQKTQNHSNSGGG